jgi:DivIVA protein
VSTPDQFQRPPLRYRRFGGGYRREDVEFALAELRLTLQQVHKDLESLRDRNRELEAELQHARAEVADYRGRERALSETMSAALRHAAEIEEAATIGAREITAQAEEAAVRMSAEASRRIEESSAQLNELLRLRDNLIEAMRSVVGDFDRAISRAERGELFAAVEGAPGQTADEVPPPAQGRPSPVEAAHAPQPEPRAVPPPSVAPPEPAASAPPPAPDTASIPVSAPLVSPPAAEPQPAAAAPTPPIALAPPEPAGVPAPPSGPPEPSPEGELFETRVELDAGPFSDFVALRAFERSLAQLPKIDDVYVRRVGEDRAVIELTLSESAPLLQTMRELLPYSLVVRSANSSKLVVDVAAQAAAATR